MYKRGITGLAVAIVFVSFLLSTFVSLWSLHSVAQDNMERLSKELASRIFDTISSEMTEPVVIAQTMSNDSFLIDLLKNENKYSESNVSEIMRDYLSGLSAGLDYESAFVISEDSRRYYTLSGIGKVIDPENNPVDVWYTDFLKKEIPYETVVDVDDLREYQWTVFVNSRIVSDGRLLGVCGVGAQMNASRKLLTDLEREYNVRICLTDTDGVIRIDSGDRALEKLDINRLRMGGRETEYVMTRIDNGFVVTKYIDKLDWYLVVQSDGINERSQVISIIVLNIALCLFVMILMLIAIRIIILRTISLANASFKDQTTMLYNRRAYEEEKERLLGSRLGRDFVFGTVDINGLKSVNDNLGHSAGDELINGAAMCLKACFGKLGKIFRVGGDEFMLVLNCSEEQLEHASQLLERMTEDWSGSQVDKLRVSCGYASVREFPEMTLPELISVSDERMYQAKAEYYEKTGLKRRV